MLGPYGETLELGFPRHLASLRHPSIVCAVWDMNQAG
jgi:hypothetical protein